MVASPQNFDEEDDAFSARLRSAEARLRGAEEEGTALEDCHPYASNALFELEINFSLKN